MTQATAVAVPSQAGQTGKNRYAHAVATSKRIRWDIDRDVIRGRSFDFGKRFLPDGLSKVDALGFLDANERRFLSQIQGRTYANMFGLVERFIAAKVLEMTGDHRLGDQDALEALVRFGDEEIKHQELFRRIERMCGEGMPQGYVFVPEPNAVASAVLSKSTWAVLALTCHIELFVLTHYRQSIGTDEGSSDLWKDVFLYHWREESQHAIIDELEWKRVDARLMPAERDAAVGEFIELVGAVDSVLKLQADSDAKYFIQAAGREFSSAQSVAIHDTLLKAYRWQYIVSGAQEERFVKVLQSLTTPAQLNRIVTALGPIANHATH